MFINRTGVSLFAYFFGVAKSKAYGGTRPAGLAFNYYKKYKEQQINNLLAKTIKKSLIRRINKKFHINSMMGLLLTLGTVPLMIHGERSC
jgi:hypothetical protein